MEGFGTGGSGMTLSVCVGQIVNGVVDTTVFTGEAGEISIIVQSLIEGFHGDSIFVSVIRHEGEDELQAADRGSNLH